MPFAGTGMRLFMLFDEMRQFVFCYGFFEVHKI
jgi:hypothetical protein